MLMFVGGSGGSTSGGFKIIRLIILLKGVYALIRYKLNPKFGKLRQHRTLGRIQILLRILDIMRNIYAHIPL